MEDSTRFNDPGSPSAHQHRRMVFVARRSPVRHHSPCLSHHVGATRYCIRCALAVCVAIVWATRQFDLQHAGFTRRMVKGHRAIRVRFEKLTNRDEWAATQRHARQAAVRRGPGPARRHASTHARAPGHNIGPVPQLRYRAYVSGWRCRESNPGPPSHQQGFSVRSPLCLYLDLLLTQTSQDDDPSRCLVSPAAPRPTRRVRAL